MRAEWTLFRQFKKKSVVPQHGIETLQDHWNPLLSEEETVAQSLSETAGERLPRSRNKWRASPLSGSRWAGLCDRNCEDRLCIGCICPDASAIRAANFCSFLYKKVFLGFTFLKVFFRF